MTKNAIKIVILGDSGVGKSSILQMYCGCNNMEEYNPTIGVEFGSKNLEINNEWYRIHIWDTAGQEKYRSLISSYYRNAVVIFVVFDLTSMRNFDRLEYWINEINKFVGIDDYHIMIVGNKSDKHDPSLEDCIEIDNFATKHGASYEILSAKNKLQVCDLFTKAIDIGIKKQSMNTSCSLKVNEDKKSSCCIGNK